MILSPNKIISRLEETVLALVNDKRNRSVAVWTILFSLVAHGFRWFNAYFFHDSLIIYQGDGSQQALLGRFLVPFWLLVRGKIATPLPVAFFSVCFLCLANILIVKLLDIKRPPHIIALCALVAASPTVSCLYAYFIPSTDIHMLATLLAVGSVWLLCRFKWGWIPASFCLAGSMALYESYAEVAVVLLFLLVIKDLVQDRDGYDTQSGCGPQELRQASKWKGNHFCMTYSQAYTSYFKNVLGYPFNGCGRATMTRFSGMTEVIGMPSFPSQGCVKMLRDTLVVKLSDDGVEDAAG